MRSRARLLLVAATLLLAQAGAASHTFFYHVAGDDHASWPAVLSSIGLIPGASATSGVVVRRTGTASLAEQWLARVEQGTYLVLEGDSEIASEVGFRKTLKKVPVRNVKDHQRPQQEIIWEQRLELPVFEVPEGSRVFASERWTGAPLVAGFRRGKGAVLWVAVSPGEAGYERFPYLLHALQDLGLEPPFRSRRFWAFFDSSYRSRVDLDYFATRWRRIGLGALHVAAWHYFEPDQERDDYLRRLIEACHRNAIQVYAWLELPHVSEAFWGAHPEWRERTAIGQDAHLDWRKLMNRANRDCHRAVADGVHKLIDRFDWDGVNLAELYFESLEGHENPARFTPLNKDVRLEFTNAHGFDPLALFDESSSLHHSRHPEGLRQFLDYRAGLAKRMQQEWIAEIEQARARKRHLDLVLTHVDDRFDTRMRDLIGADAASLLPLLERHDFTFLIEDPATIWHLGPTRYSEIASRYEPLTSRPEKLSIDINIVKRYQDVYPTKQQTGTELFQQIHAAAAAFPIVALYAEHSMQPSDIDLLPSALASPSRVERLGPKLVIESRFGAGIPWSGGALVNGQPWPAQNDDTLWLPAGAHAVEASSSVPSMRLLDFNGELKTVFAAANGVELAYRSSSRAFAVVDREPESVEVDGAALETRIIADDGRWLIFLPRGQHLVLIQAAGLGGRSSD
ncbi:MAG: hypothetical protein GY953_21055 [bacterium]|nr:hypothetical protein [bacterium]